MFEWQIRLNKYVRQENACSLRKLYNTTLAEGISLTSQCGYLLGTSQRAINIQRCEDGDRNIQDQTISLHSIWFGFADELHKFTHLRRQCNIRSMRDRHVANYP